MVSCVCSVRWPRALRMRGTTMAAIPTWNGQRYQGREAFLTKIDGLLQFKIPEEGKDPVGAVVVGAMVLQEEFRSEPPSLSVLSPQRVG